MKTVLRNPRSQELQLGDRVTLRKPHPCGGNSWLVWKLGMDVGLQCETCGRKLRFDRTELDRQIRKVFKSGCFAERSML